MTQPSYLDFHAATLRLRLDPHEPAFFQNPYPAYRWLQEQSPVFYWEDFGAWCVASYEGVNGLLRDRNFGREKPGGYRPYVLAQGERAHLTDFDAVEARSMLELEPPIHTRLRTLVNRAFVSRQVERLRPRAEQLAHERIDAFEADGRADLIPAFATPIPITIIAEMLGVPPEDGPMLLDWSHRMVVMYMHGLTRQMEESANQAARDFSDYIRDHARKRASDPRDDLLSLLTSARDEGQKLDEDELVASAILLLNAGHEATVHQTGNAIRTILKQGGDARRFFTDEAATVATVEECLRFDAPLHMFNRFAVEDREIAPGVTVKAGERIWLMLGAANTDPAAFADPLEFRPGRPDQKNVSFGAGIHFCIGAPLARLEMQASLKVLFERLPGLKLAEEPAYRDTYHFHGLERLLVEW
ncbi:cytochrome P450 [Aliihoeflea aestuarii]|uniref:cytochrome P450 n=1 Tax=Aliihoeflea aestuarii TaxID=453840 RepID=UPI0020922E66|nr:cytochrome P450 [Aliihoeflea aestuarii]MCO6391960.1 cytochrome P450 [Aliihoeflea aestuarii]